MKPEVKKETKKPSKKQVTVKMRVNIWTVIFGILLTLFFLPSVFSLLGIGTTDLKVDLSTALTDLKDEKIEKVSIEKNNLILTYKDKTTKLASKEEGQSFTDLLVASEIDPNKLQFTVVDQTFAKAMAEVISIVLPIILLGGLFFYMMKSQTRGAQDIFSFGKSKAKIFAKGKQDTTFADVAGVDEAKKELVEVVDFLKNPDKYKKIGARTPKGVLLFGPSGVGKTMLAKAVAGEANVPFFSMAGSEFMEMLVGIGASVTGDTPILIKERDGVCLISIGEFVDKFYSKNSEGLMKVKGVETLGLKPEVNKFWGSRSNVRPVFGGSKWQGVDSVYRHKVKEIYEINFLGGKIKTTADHSVFVREYGGIRAKETKDLRPGDVLVNLPMNTRAWNSKLNITEHFIKKHEFPIESPQILLDFWQDNPDEIKSYEYAMANQGTMAQYAIAEEIGVSQATVGNWQSGKHLPQSISKKAIKLSFPDTVKVTPELMKLFGYYTAEGRGTKSLEFTFGSDEIELVKDVAKLMNEVFGLKDPKIVYTDTNSIRIIYYSAHLGRFFTKHCGNGSHNKHLPNFIWSLSGEYFLQYLKGYWEGDGYRTKEGKLSMTSVSHQLIKELTWLCSMHGIKVGVKHEFQKEGRSILHGKPLPETESWTLIIGKTSDPFSEGEKVGHFKRAIIKSVNKKKYDGFVYDLCGVENEAFFGGESPTLLHNSRVRDLFAQAKAQAPSIIFIDEIDAIGRQRGRSGLVGGHDEREQTLNQILVEMDGFTPNESVIVLAATNRGDLLDPALLRPGRFDRRVTLDMPDKEGRQAILTIHSKGKTFGKSINWARIADRTVGFSGADLENMLNEAAIGAARLNKPEIDMTDIEESATKVKLGPAKKRLQSAEDKKITAYHEAGHAIVTHFTKGMDPVHRISIVARGMSLGHTLIPPVADRTHDTKTRLLDQITAMLGGRAAEQFVFHEMTSGASNDIANATRVARAMVIEWGMSSLGPVNFGPDTSSGEFGQTDWYQENAASPAMQEKIDNEVRHIMENGLKEAEKLVKKYKSKLDLVAEELLVKETVDKDQFEKIVGKKINGEGMGILKEVTSQKS
ncbi:MAG: ATP-dependent zinc metalloprotease FtsH [Candidatus Woesebacteria bacterium GW2011_GWA1_33_30]|uniref:ATP-dependent zinc metalloprotease FtsH n=1 Tax=Candidatus Woesebacteria bacterium GW2011_GWA2_33_28 TaxID=1618561 RepID=A0A0F9ZTA7_9BACT|nr:MAG: ATP-dependent zinc metalloprotease FtsH [Candidatus Woesebacteria bacterium GW2011_GWA2_33_28]KKP48390.1 MAG: ATP-dependent zinc metalloprotease FtsH [Candidatus Woesebacteria bacterium GW2011_GWA1_33_30]KKP49497.1 MAG: ATP-dependent zinc metalloprotease FtsH [Microgenomates group bacterium GW2011_GWC1_33_32]KKP52462.1 MAG: ATP-dependent zinc metalloprotease FtsH [Candidatus Woesebacteria bacterium GW2011_GWB1_33_38]KKP57190.1 MAG: ATP-dependent zinc metalloprotease FtsH [Microgenomates